jgi:hypothetical protein
MTTFSRAVLPLTFAATVFLAGCSSLTQKQVNIDPIAEQAGELIAKVEAELQTEDAVLLMRYLRVDEIEEVEEWDVAWRDLIASLRSIGRYSVVLIDIAGSREEEGSRQQLANNINQLYVELRSRETMEPELTGVDLDQVLGEIDNADGFYEASAATQAAIQPVVEMLTTRLSLMNTLSDDMRLELLLRIDAYHADVIRYQDKVAMTRNREIGLLEVYDRAITDNDLEAWKQFRNADVELKAVLRNFKKPTAEAIKISDDLMYDRLNRIDRIWQILDPDFQLYQQEVAELRRLFKSVDSTLIVAQLSVASWDRGHDLFVKGKSGGFVTYTSALLNYAVSRAPDLIF